MIYEKRFRWWFGWKLVDISRKLGNANGWLGKLGWRIAHKGMRDIDVVPTL